MDTRRVALVASWPQRHIDDHQTWLAAHGPHWHGCAHPLSPENRAKLAAAIEAFGRVDFFAYLARGRGGAGAVRYRIGVDRFTYRWPAEPFAHEHGDHGEPEPYAAILVVRVISVDELPAARDIGAFTTVSGKALTPRAMRGLYVVEAPEDGTPGARDSGARGPAPGAAAAAPA